MRAVGEQLFLGRCALGAIDVEAQTPGIGEAPTAPADRLNGMNVRAPIPSGELR